MQILSIGNFTRGWDGSICDEEHIAVALEILGHKVCRLQRENVVNGTCLETGFDFVLVAQWDRYPDNMLEDITVPIIYWAFDHQADHQEWHERLIAQADLYLSKRFADSKYSNWQWLSQDFAPTLLDKTPGNEKDIDVLFTGSYLPWATERYEILKAIDENFNLTVYSFTPDDWRDRGFKNVNGPVMDEGLPGLYARAKINISIDHTIEAGYWSDRNAQIMACGGFVLARYVPMMETVFRENIAYFYNTEDCLEKLGNLLRPDIAYTREDYAQKGYEYAQKNLMVRNRVMDLLTIVGSIL